MAIKKTRKSNKPKPHNCNTMTDAGKKALIVNALRQVSVYWKPKNLCLKNAERGVIWDKWLLIYDETGEVVTLKTNRKIKDTSWKFYENEVGKKVKGYECSECSELFPKKLMKVDHTEPVVPTTGWVGFDSWVERCFVEVEGFQALCKFCHDVKSKEENRLRRESKKLKEKK